MHRLAKPEAFGSAGSNPAASAKQYYDLALDRIRFVDRAGMDVAIRDTREILEGWHVGGDEQ